MKLDSLMAVVHDCGDFLPLIKLKVLQFSSGIKEENLEDDLDARKSKKVLQEDDWHQMHNTDAEFKKPTEDTSQNLEKKKDDDMGGESSEVNKMAVVGRKKQCGSKSRTRFGNWKCVVRFLILILLMHLGDAFRVHGPCNDAEFYDKISKTCHSCPYGTFITGKGHGNENCKMCRKAVPAEHTVIIQNCTNYTDAIIGCETGYFDTKEDLAHGPMCDRLPNTPEPNTSITTQKPTSEKTNTSLPDLKGNVTRGTNPGTESENGHSSLPIPAVILGVLFALIFLVALVRCVYLKIRKCQNIGYTQPNG